MQCVFLIVKDYLPLKNIFVKSFFVIVLAAMVLNFGDISVRQYCTGKNYGSE